MRGNPSLCVLWLLCVCCSSCEIGPQQKVAVPPPPPPVAAKPAPVVVAQTVAQLPDPQPVPPDSIAPRPPVEYQPPAKEAEPETVETPQDPKTAHQLPKSSRPARRPAADVPAQPEVTPPATAPTPVDEPTAAPTPPKLSAADEVSISKDRVNATLAEVQQLLKEISKQPPTPTSKAAMMRIRSFVRLSEQSMAKNDLRQSDILARRALALAHDLVEPK
jgi:hypothetical protein